MHRLTGHPWGLAMMRKRGGYCGDARAGKRRLSSRQLSRLSAS
jgi:hypothetical protein